MSASAAGHTGHQEFGALGGPKDEVAVTQMSLAQLRLLLEGFELKSRRGWRRYEKRMSKPAAEEIVTRDL